MSEIKIIDDAFKEFDEDRTATWVLTNIVDELNEPDSVEYFLSKIKPYSQSLYIDVGPDLVEDLLKRWINLGGNVTNKDFEEFADWVNNNLDADGDLVPNKTSQCLRVATLYSPDGNYFSDDEDENRRFSDMNLLKIWVEKAIHHASDIDEWIEIIESVSGSYQGMHLRDVEWGKEILDTAINSLDEKEAKKIKPKAEAIFEDV